MATPKPPTDTAINGPSSSHAILSPSSAHRWLNCSPSARLEQNFPDTTSDFAEEGTTAHEVSELLLKKEFKIIKPAAFDKRMKEIAAGRYYSSEMRKYCDDYVDYVIGRFNEVKQHTPDARIFFETKVDLTTWVPEGYGTRDVAIVGDGKVIMIDLKYGKGVPVFATNNEQLMQYAAGTVADMDFEFGINEVEIVIHQPRLDNISSWTVLSDELMHWATTVLAPGADKAFKGEGEFVPGEHCRFCKAKATCKALATEMLEVDEIAATRHDPALMTDVEITGVLHKLDRLTDWAGAVKEHALATALAGKQWPGFKLVEGRSIRKYADEAKIAEVLADTPGIWKAPELLGITAMEGLLGKKPFAELVGPFVVKPPGKPTLVPESDKRPVYVINTAANDFAEEVVD